MAYDGKIMHRAILRFEEDRQAREARFLARREDIFRPGRRGSWPGGRISFTASPGCGRSTISSEAP